MADVNIESERRLTIVLEDVMAPLKNETKKNKDTQKKQERNQDKKKRNTKIEVTRKYDTRYKLNRERNLANSMDFEENKNKIIIPAESTKMVVIGGLLRKLPNDSCVMLKVIEDDVPGVKCPKCPKTFWSKEDDLEFAVSHSLYCCSKKEAQKKKQNRTMKKLIYCRDIVFICSLCLKNFDDLSEVIEHKDRKRGCFPPKRLYLSISQKVSRGKRFKICKRCNAFKTISLESFFDHFYKCRSNMGNAMYNALRMRIRRNMRFAKRNARRMCDEH